MSARRLKSRVAAGLQRLHLLSFAERIFLWGHVVATAPANRRFARTHAGFATPPHRLAFEALGHVSAAQYHASGERHARMVVEVIRRHRPGARPRVVEWGCGPGRIIRHLRAAGLDPGAELVGFDVNPAALAWCRAHLPGIEFRDCGLAPPLPVADGGCDVLYHYSVWSHLSEARVQAWVRDMARALDRDGLMIGTSHGDRYADMLLPGEAASYRDGSTVERRGFPEGRKRFLAFHPPALLEGLLRKHFRDVEHRAAPDALEFPQDLWIARAPRHK